jgi:hypothetical protein
MAGFKKYTLSLLIVIAAPLLMAFFLEDGLNQRLFQKRKEVSIPQKVNTLESETGYKVTIEFEKGKSHNHPLMAFWIEDTTGNYVQSLYVAESIAKGYFGHGDASTGRWQPGPLRRPAALPYWGHKRGVEASDGFYIPSQDQPMPDAVSGATPKGDFILESRTREGIPEIFYVMMEINQSWDWNRYWHNNRFPDDANYKTSSQPALVYKAKVDVNTLQYDYELTPAGHSHWSGENGNLYEDLSTITTALDIAKKIRLKVVL